MKTHKEYLKEACQYLDDVHGHAPPTNIMGGALPTQMQSINVALIMAITDLIAAIEAKK